MTTTKVGLWLVARGAIAASLSVAAGTAVYFLNNVAVVRWGLIVPRAAYLVALFLVMIGVFSISSRSLRKDLKRMMPVDE